MVPQLDNLKKVIKEFHNFLDDIERPETRENVDFILKRLKNAMFCLVYGKDQSNASISRSIVGEFLLKTWRISREPEILGSVLEYIPRKLDLYNTLCDKILNFANIFLGSRFRELYKIEEYSTIIIKYLLETSITFNQITQMEIVSDYKKNMNLISESMEELAFMIYNGINDHSGSIIPFSLISKSIKKIWKRIRNVNWKQMLSPGMRFKAHELEKICGRFGAVMYPYLEKAAHDTREIGGIIPKTSLESPEVESVPYDMIPDEVSGDKIVEEESGNVFPDETVEEIIEEEQETLPLPEESDYIQEPALVAPDEISAPVETEDTPVPDKNEKSTPKKGSKKLLKKAKTPISERLASRKTSKPEPGKVPVSTIPETNIKTTDVQQRKIKEVEVPVISSKQKAKLKEEKKSQQVKGFKN